MVDSFPLQSNPMSIRHAPSRQQPRAPFGYAGPLAVAQLSAGTPSLTSVSTSSATGSPTTLK